MGKLTRTLMAAAAVAAACAALAISAIGASAAGGGRRDTGTVYASIVHLAGGLLYAAGYSHDKLFGDVAVVYVVKPSAGQSGTIKITAKKVTLYTSTGALTGTGSANQSSTGAVSDGKVSLTHGTGGQAGHTFRGTFSGSFDSKTGTYTFHFKATYK